MTKTNLVHVNSGSNNDLPRSIVEELATLDDVTLREVVSYAQTLLDGRLPAVELIEKWTDEEIVGISERYGYTLVTKNHPAPTVAMTARTDRTSTAYESNVRLRATNPCFIGRFSVESGSNIPAYPSVSISFTEKNSVQLRGATTHILTIDSGRIDCTAVSVTEREPGRKTV